MEVPFNVSCYCIVSRHSLARHVTYSGEERVTYVSLLYKEFGSVHKCFEGVTKISGRYVVVRYKCVPITKINR